MPPPPATTPVLRVRPAVPSDLARTARWQCRHLPHGFFPSLGRGFVARWHGAHLDAPHGVALVAELVGGSEAVPVGFLVGATDQRALVAEVVARHRWSLAAAGARALGLRPRAALRFVRTRARPYARRLLGTGGRGPADAAAAPPRSTDDRAPVAVVAAVVVAPAARGAGVGEALLEAFAARARAAGTTTAELVTRADGGATAFYERLGWERVADRSSKDGARVLTYRTDLTPSGAAAPHAPHAPARHTGAGSGGFRLAGAGCAPAPGRGVAPEPRHASDAGAPVAAGSPRAHEAGAGTARRSAA
ncbi:GNAT family N-acetyltransferase [Pseudokineococcus marinus]|uniref:GNAT family N-acetyltransferase n=1 Tax=Pseudokineococcus marinus TaxID=351215 RepID=UPI0030B1CBA1